MKTSDAFPSNYLKASDLAGRIVPVTISHIKPEPVGPKREMKLIVYFEGKDKGLVLNKTNCKMIERLAGSDETDDWPGTRIALKTAEVEFQGGLVEAIRVQAPLSSALKPRRPEPEPPPTREPGDDDIDDIAF